MRHMSANRQWKVVDEQYSGNVFTDDHWYSTHIPRIVRVWTTQTTHKIRKPAQYCANFYAKTSFELLKTWNRVKHRHGEHRRTTAEVPRQKNWWNAQIADVSRKTRNLCVIHAFTRILGSVTGPLHRIQSFNFGSANRSYNPSTIFMKTIQHFHDDQDCFVDVHFSTMTDSHIKSSITYQSIIILSVCLFNLQPSFKASRLVMKIHASVNWTRSSLVQVMACHLFSDKPLPEPVTSHYLNQCWLIVN